MVQWLIVYCAGLHKCPEVCMLYKYMQRSSQAWRETIQCAGAYI